MLMHRPAIVRSCPFCSSWVSQSMSGTLRLTASWIVSQHPEWGETPIAVVVPRGEIDTDAVTAELTALCRAELAGYKQPRRFVFRTEFPLGPAGKILKRVIADDLRAVAAE